MAMQPNSPREVVPRQFIMRHAPLRWQYDEIMSPLRGYDNPWLLIGLRIISASHVFHGDQDLPAGLHTAFTVFPQTPQCSCSWRTARAARVPAPTQLGSGCITGR